MTIPSWPSPHLNKFIYNFCSANRWTFIHLQMCWLKSYSHSKVLSPSPLAATIADRVVAATAVAIAKPENTIVAFILFWNVIIIEFWEFIVLINFEMLLYTLMIELASGINWIPSNRPTCRIKNSKYRQQSYQMTRQRMQTNRHETALKQPSDVF